MARSTKTFILLSVAFLLIAAWTMPLTAKPLDGGPGTYSPAQVPNGVDLGDGDDDDLNIMMNAAFRPTDDGARMHAAQTPFSMDIGDDDDDDVNIIMIPFGLRLLWILFG